MLLFVVIFLFFLFGVLEFFWLGSVDFFSG